MLEVQQTQYNLDCCYLEGNHHGLLCMHIWQPAGFSAYSQQLCLRAEHDKKQEPSFMRVDMLAL